MQTYINTFKYLLNQSGSHSVLVQRLGITLELQDLIQQLPTNLVPKVGTLIGIENGEAKDFVSIPHGLKETYITQKQNRQNYIDWYRKTRFSSINQLYKFIPLRQLEASSPPNGAFVSGVNPVDYQNTIELLESLSLILSPTGFDIVPDIIGTFYASYYGDITNAGGFGVGIIPVFGNIRNLKPIIEKTFKGKLRPIWSKTAQKFILEGGEDILLTPLRKISVNEFSLKNISNLGDVALTKNDGIIDVLVHYEQGQYWVYIEKSGSFEKSLTGLDEAGLASYLKQELENSTDAIRFLSCSNLASAEALSKLLPNKIIATNDLVRIHPDGGITTIARSGNATQKWDVLQGGKKVEGETHTPTPPSNANKTRFVRMGIDFDVSYEYGEVSVKLNNEEVGIGGLGGKYKDGYLMETEIDVKRGDIKLAKGEDVFNTIYERIITENDGDINIISGIRGIWYDALPDNLNSFNDAILKYVNTGQKSIEFVALNNTFTGIMAQRKSFNKVISIEGQKRPDGTYEYVSSIIFSK